MGKIDLQLIAFDLQKRIVFLERAISRFKVKNSSYNQQACITFNSGVSFVQGTPYLCGDGQERNIVLIRGSMLMKNQVKNNIISCLPSYRCIVNIVSIVNQDDETSATKEELIF